jgi:hypothetical protein
LRGIPAVPIQSTSVGGLGASERKRSEPQAGSEAQQTHGLLAEETVGVVRNHEGGTGLAVW